MFSSIINLLLHQRIQKNEFIRPKTKKWTCDFLTIDSIVTWTERLNSKSSITFFLFLFKMIIDFCSIPLRFIPRRVYKLVVCSLLLFLSKADVLYTNRVVSLSAYCDCYFYDITIDRNPKTVDTFSRSSSIYIALGAICTAYYSTDLISIEYISGEDMCLLFSPDTIWTCYWSIVPLRLAVAARGVHIMDG